MTDTNYRNRIKCLFGLHDYGHWVFSWDMLPCIVKSSLEYMNEPKWWGRRCQRCSASQTRKTKP